MIYIEKNEKILLPKEYHKINNICAIIYDQLTEIFVDKNYSLLFQTEIKFDKTKHILIKEFRKKKIHPIDWLEANKLDDELTAVLVKHLTTSITSDFINFMYESLSCAKKGKMTVAYALLRKPLTDELLILEQILYDPKDFIRRFYHSGNPADYDPSNKEIDKKNITKNAITKLKPNIIFTEDLIYELRYDKTSDTGINGISNHALHIVTNDRNYKTENQNLNFVFSNSEDINRYWNHYYYFVPYLLLYGVTIIDNIIFSYLPDKANQDLHTVKSFRRLIGTLMWTDITSPNMRKATKKMFDTISSAIILDCQKCNKKVKFSKADFILFFESEHLLCSKCFDDLLCTHEAVSPIRELMQNFSL